MSNPFFDHPIINSPYARPERHWELDADGQPTQRVMEERRRAQFVTPVPAPKKKKKASAKQDEMVFGDELGLSDAKQQYEQTSIINEVRGQIELPRSLVFRRQQPRWLLIFSTTGLIRSRPRCAPGRADHAPMRNVAPEQRLRKIGGVKKQGEVQIYRYISLHHLRPRSNETRRCVLWLKWIRRRPVQGFIWEMRAQSNLCAFTFFSQLEATRANFIPLYAVRSLNSRKSGGASKGDFL